MASDVLQKEIIGLREDDINLLIEYARFLKHRVTSRSIVPSTTKNKRQIGFMSNAFVSIAPDFDETPDCLKEYV